MDFTKPYVIPSLDRSVITVIFPNGIDTNFLRKVRIVYDIKDTEYSTAGLNPEIRSEDGHAVIYHRKPR